MRKPRRRNSDAFGERIVGSYIPGKPGVLRHFPPWTTRFGIESEDSVDRRVRPLQARFLPLRTQAIFEQSSSLATNWYIVAGERVSVLKAKVPRGLLPVVVRLQKQLSRRFGGKEYVKWVVVLPPRIVKQLGWKEGEYFEIQIERKALR